RPVRLTPGENERHHAVLGVGGAIVADSDGMAEWRECLVKGGFTRGSASGFDLIETMRFDPEEGVPRLERHLERIKASAAELGFAFDRHDTRNRIQALCFELESPAKLRLMVSRSGASSSAAARARSNPPRSPSRRPASRSVSLCPSRWSRATAGFGTGRPTAAATGPPWPPHRAKALARQCSYAMTRW